MRRVQTGCVAQPEQQESEEECDHRAGSSQNSSHPRGLVQSWDRSVHVMPFKANRYPSLASISLDLSSSMVIILEVRTDPI